MPEPLYSHQLLDDQFPGICFLGEPQEVAVLQSKPVTLSPPGLGVTFKIPPNAVQSSDEPVNVSLRTCLSTSVFQYPKGCTPLSAVYHISSDSAFKRDLELTFEHFADLETDRQARKMTFFRTECDGKGKYTFTPIVGGEFKVNGHHCTISTRHFGFVCAGSMPYSEIRKLLKLINLCLQPVIMCYTVQGNATLCCVAIPTRLNLLDKLLLLYLLMLQSISQ